MSDQSFASRLAERLLVGAIETIARAGAKAAESIAHDVKTALRTEADKAEFLEAGVKFWRQARLGEVGQPPPEAATQKEETSK